MKENWTYKKLGELCSITSGFTPKAEELSSFGKFPYFKVADMNSLGNEVFLSLTDAYLCESKKFHPKGSVVFPKNGATIATNKKRILKQDSIVDLNTAVACFNNKIIDVKYSYYWFMNIDFKDYMRGGALPTLDIKSLKSTLIPLPPLSIQQSIVAELDEINNLLQLKKKELETFDKLAQSIFYEMFGDPVTNEKGWEVKKLGEIAEATIGLTYKPENVSECGTIVLRSGNIQDSSLAFDDIVRVNSKIPENKYVNEGDILMCTRNGSFRLVGKVAVITKLQERMSYGAFMTIIRSNMNPYLFEYFKTPAFRDHLISGKTTTVNQITVKMLNDVKLPVPSLSLQQVFADRNEAIEQQKEQVKASINKLEALLASRMQYWFD